MSNYLFTSESVSEGHPDKLADQISDAVLDAILAQEYGDMLALIEQLEVGLEKAETGGKADNVRTTQSDAVPEEYQESVAEYFRRLSRDR